MNEEYKSENLNSTNVLLCSFMRLWEPFCFRVKNLSILCLF